MKTFLPKLTEQKREWYLVDAKGKTLGRLAVKIANVLRGKQKTIFCPQVDTGDFVIVLNAAGVKLSGKKEEQKIYQRFSGYRSGLQRISASVVRERHPERLIQLAVKRMMPKNALTRKMLTRLRVYAGDKHPHAAQKPRLVD
jgi:large subunit ribosomal protein L13